MALDKWKKLSSKTILKNDHWSYNLDEFETGRGRKGEYHYAHTAGSTMIIPITTSNKILLVRQFRYLNQKEGLEFPCGAVAEGLTAEQNARKELREETGYDADVIEHAAEFSPYTGASDEICTVFIAKGLKHSPLSPDEFEEFELEEYSADEFGRLIDNKEIWDGLTLSAWTLAKSNIEKLTNRTTK